MISKATQLTPVTQVYHPLLSKFKIKLFIKRDDLIHPIISGNKWRKLKYNIKSALAENKHTIISFGGAFSNHIHALAYACKSNNLQSIGIIRGEPQYQSNFTLSWAKYWGMELQFVDRKTYKLRDDSAYLSELQNNHEDALIVPEGGSNTLALPGMAEVIDELQLQLDYDYLLTPVGSGGTLAGLIQADKNRHQLLGIAVLKQQGYLQQQVTQLLTQPAVFNNWQIFEQFHRGGYGKYKIADAKRILEFSTVTKIPFEPVYSGKMLLAFLDLLEQGYFPENAQVVMLHTGGIQGLGGMAERGLIDAQQWPIPAKAPTGD